MALYQKIYRLGDSVYKFYMYIDETNDPWFKGKDIASILQYKNTTYAIEKYVDEAKKMPLNAFNIQSLNGLEPSTMFINKDGLTKLCSHTRRSEANTFLQWVEQEEKNLRVKNNQLFIRNDIKVQLEDDIEELLNLRVKNNQSFVQNDTKEQWEKDLEEFLNPRVKNNQTFIRNNSKEQWDNDIKELLNPRAKTNQSFVVNDTKDQLEKNIEEFLNPQAKNNQLFIRNNTKEQQEEVTEEEHEYMDEEQQEEREYMDEEQQEEVTEEKREYMDEEQQEEATEEEHEYTDEVTTEEDCGYMNNIEEQQDHTGSAQEQLKNDTEEKQQEDVEQQQEHRNDLKVLLHRINKRMKNMDKINEHISFIISKIRKQNSKVASIPKDKRVQHHLKVYRKQMEDGRFKYRFLRPQKRNLARSMKRIKGYRKVKQWKNVPNPIHVVNVLKEILRKRRGIKFMCHNNDIIVNVKIEKFIKRAFYKDRLSI